MKIVEITYRFEARDTPARPRPTDSNAARHRLDEGNQAFAALLEGLVDEHGIARRVVAVDSCDLGLSPSGRRAPTQRPFAAVLGCSDARVPVEFIFNEGPNDLFVVRVAGNGLGTDVLASLKYATEHLGGSLKLVVVLGHSGCGAISAAVDVFLDPAKYLPLATKHSLRNILDRLLIVVHASATKLSEIFGPAVTQHPGYRAALIEVAIVTNAALTAYTVQQELGTSEASDLRAVYGVYLIATRQIWAPRGGAEWIGLADPPRDLAAFVDFGNTVTQSDRIGALLKAE
jgi:carbonic anhydrase